MAPTIDRTSPARKNSASNVLLVVALLTYLAALALPAYRTGYEEVRQVHYGLEALILGPIGLLYGQVSWFANPFLLAALSARMRSTRRSAVALALIALATGSSFLLGKTVALGSAGETPYQVALGFYVWLVSIGLTCLSALLYTRSPKSVGASGVAS
jgi:hypothetical protein